MKNKSREKLKAFIVAKAFLLPVFLFCSVAKNEAAAQKKSTGKETVYAAVAISNPSAFARNEVVAIPWNGADQITSAIDTSLLSVWESKSKASLLYQFETAGSGKIQNLLVLVNLPAKSTQTVMLVKAKHPPFQPLTYGRFVPERKDDFAWENNRIAFRMYGKALEGSNENAYGIDVWTKRTENLVINDWYRTGDYHKDHGQGLDYYSVGFSLGAGDVAVSLGDSLLFNHNFDRWELLDNGPLRTTFRLSYPAKLVQGKTLSVSKTISLDAGSQLNKITAAYSWEGDALPLAIGLVRRAGAGVQLLDEKAGILGYWEPTDPAAGTTGTGVICTDAPTRVKQDKQHWLLTGLRTKDLTYYAGACWDKAGRIRNQTQWFDYLQSFRERLREPLLVQWQSQSSR